MGGPLAALMFTKTLASEVAKERKTLVEEATASAERDDEVIEELSEAGEVAALMVDLAELLGYSAFSRAMLFRSLIKDSEHGPVYAVMTDGTCSYVLRSNPTVVQVPWGSLPGTAPCMVETAAHPPAWVSASGYTWRGQVALFPSPYRAFACSNACQAPASCVVSELASRLINHTTRLAAPTGPRGWMAECG